MSLLLLIPDEAAPRILDAVRNIRTPETVLAAVLNDDGNRAFKAEIVRNVHGLFRLGEEHLAFAKGINAEHWRQIVSRAYYGAYQTSRAVRLHFNGAYSTDVSDHDKLTKLPDGFPGKAKYETELKLFRADRNIADYDHLARPSDLAKTVEQWAALATEFIADARGFLRARGEAL